MFRQSCLGIFGIFRKKFVEKNYLNNCRLLFAHRAASFNSAITFSCVTSKRGYMELSKIVSVFESKAPLHLAEPWDNVGLLVEPPGLKTISAVFFTNDLTEAVLNEAVFAKVDMIYCYHPPVFSPIKSLKMSKWKDQIIMTCIQEKIAVYSPHTACDSVHNGVNDWLIGCFELKEVKPIKQCEGLCDENMFLVTCLAPVSYDLSIVRALSVESNIFSEKQTILTLKTKVAISNLSPLLTLIKEDKELNLISLTPVVHTSINGAGRVGQLKEPITITDAVQCIKDHIQLPHVRISMGKSHSLDSMIKSIAVCAGSGASVLRGVIADLYVTGEMSHHDLLEASHCGSTTILCEHSNSERGYLKKLVKDLGKEDLKDVSLIISQHDKDPVCIV